MQTPSKTLIDLEKKFWQSMVDQDTDAALSMLNEPAMMVSRSGALKFDHTGYRKMAEEGSMVLNKFELRDMEVMFPNDETAILTYRVSQEVAPRGSSKAAAPQEMSDTSTWVRGADGWRCVIHTETPLDAKAAAAPERR